MKRVLLVSTITFGLLFTSKISAQFAFSDCKKQPVYKDNGGYKKTNLLNRAKVKREAATLLICELLSQLEQKQNKNVSQSNSVIDESKRTAIADANKKIYDVAKKLEGKNFSSVKEYEEVLSVLKELRALKCRTIDPLSQFLDVKINTIFGDVNFRTGSADISQAGIIELGKIITNIKSDINEWKNYVNDCNEKVFEGELFVIVIDIDGYADQQGSSESNMQLSKERAKAVKLELVRQLNKLVTQEKYNIVFDKIQTKGHGEELPEGVIPKGENDPARRICVIKSLVGASSILKKTE
jgi:outer membrane protein OmpA-like peptidoglycan-associated protein